MEIIGEIDAMQSLARRWSDQGKRVALVPTMGALHEGHLALVREGRRLGEKLVLSIYVNPTQFGPGEDLERYPRTFDADCRAAEQAGVDVVFAPSDKAMYPPGYQTYVEVEEASRPLCGEARPKHFRGVATIVLKLFTIVRPAVALFGWKDAQQFLLLGAMVRDLNLGVEMVGVETVREEDGLALSSRNKLLGARERAAAPALHRSLHKLREAVRSGENDARVLLARARKSIELESVIRLQYLEMRSLDRLETLPRVEPGNTFVALAAHLGRTRLIDNIRL